MAYRAYLSQIMTTKQRIAKLRQHSKTVDIMTSNKRKSGTLVPITPVLKASIKYEKQLTELKDLLSWAETPVAGWLAFCGHTYTAAARKDYKKMQARIKRALK